MIFKEWFSRYKKDTEKKTGDHVGFTIRHFTEIGWDASRKNVLEEVKTMYVTRITSQFEEWLNNEREKLTDSE